MWLSGRMRLTVSISGLILAAIVAYFAVADFSYALPSIVVYGSTWVAVHLIPWKS